MPGIMLSNKMEDAAQLIADGDLALREIAERVGVSRRTVCTWKTDPVFSARVEELVADYRAEATRIGLARREARLVALNERWMKLQQVIEERAKDPIMKDVPGGDTGLLVRFQKTLGSGESAKVVDVFEVDCGLLREMREIEKQAAIETGQWTEKREVTGTERKLITVTVLGPAISMDDL